MWELWNTGPRKFRTLGPHISGNFGSLGPYIYELWNTGPIHLWNPGPIHLWDLLNTGAIRLCGGSEPWAHTFVGTLEHWTHTFVEPWAHTFVGTLEHWTHTFVGRCGTLAPYILWVHTLGQYSCANPWPIEPMVHMLMECLEPQAHFRNVNFRTHGHGSLEPCAHMDNPYTSENFATLGPYSTGKLESLVSRGTLDRSIG